MVAPLPPECEQLLIAGYVLGNLSTTESALFEEILKENPEIAKRVTKFQEALESVYGVREISPPESLKDKILAASIASKKQSSPSFRVRLLAFPWRKISSAIAVGTIIILGVTNIYFWRSLKQASMEQSEFNSKVYLLEGNNSLKKATAKVVVNSSQLKARLTTKDLPPLPPGKVYVLWTVVGQEVPFTTDSKGAILTQAFRVDNTGKFSQEITLPPVHSKENLIQKLAITIESESAPQKHTGSVLLATNSL